jgi:nucleotide-binding universal stress UspA family protein
VIEAAIAQGKVPGNEIQLLHVIETLPAVYGGAEWGYVTDWEAITAEQKKNAAEVMACVAERMRNAGIRFTTTIKDGIAKTVILDTAEKWQADLILVGSHGRGRVERFLLGSVSEAVARHAMCSVQVVRGRTAQAQSKAA